ncbi:MAG: GreA/GreB family elongation factor [Verrucomicrobia bacterium]|nr:GreA/GreB family elongation factor [Verrucomicrobiota bacterium]
MSIGTRVRVTDQQSQHSETYTVLGAWDGDPNQGVLSYLTPFAQSLMNHAVGDVVEFDQDGAKKRYRIEAIEAVNTSPVPSTAPAGGEVVASA